MATPAYPTAGFFPETFPRDPVDVNIYLEHMLLGQILEPLVETNSDGTIGPAVARTWEIRDEGKRIEFFLDPTGKFSNGAPIEGDDVVFSIKRHMTTKTSQAHSYLANIETIEAPDRFHVVLQLKRPYVAIIKALTRDQLGIVPRYWRFDKKSPEPFIGSGPYRAINENGHWFLIKNIRYRRKSSVEIERWRILLGNPDRSSTIPDFMPFVLSESIPSLKASIDNKHASKHRITHFGQSLGWWYPGGKSFDDSEKRKLGMAVHRQITDNILRKHDLPAASGVIPSGIPGYISTPISCSGCEAATPKDRTFLIAATGKDGDLVNEAEIIQKVSKSLDVTIKVIPVPVTELKRLPELAPDILVISYAGGFQDPEGFLTVISSFLSSNLRTVFGELYEDYLKASQEVDWGKRAERYKHLNKSLVETARVSPGWRWDAYRITAPHLKSRNDDISYTYKLKDLVLRKEEK